MKLFKKNRNKLVPTTCRNCGTQTQGRYCHICGQDIFSGRKIFVSHLVYSFLENAIAFDQKIPRTCYYLLFRPGFLSAEYVRGKIAQYIQPIKLIWFIIFVFFAVVTVSAIGESSDKENAKTRFQRIKEKNEEASDAQVIDRVLNEYNQTTYFRQLVKSTLPYVAFLYIPIFTLLMYLFFRNKQRFYVNHFIFSVHLYAFLFILGLLYYLINFLYPADFSYPLWLVVLMLLIPTVYYMIAIRVFYKSKYVGVILKGGYPLFSTLSCCCLYLLDMSLYLHCFLLLMIQMFGYSFTICNFSQPLASYSKR